MDRDIRFYESFDRILEIIEPFRGTLIESI